jgi:hypothetical protein
MAFQFRLSKVLEWYDRQYQAEAIRLRQSADRAATAHLELARHRERQLASETQILHLESLNGSDLRARELNRKQAKLQESRLLQNCVRAEENLVAQRAATQTAQRRVRLVEKLRDRKRDEFHSQVERRLEEEAAESYLAGFARNLSEKASI